MRHVNEALRPECAEVARVLCSRFEYSRERCVLQNENEFSTCHAFVVCKSEGPAREVKAKLAFVTQGQQMSRLRTDLLRPAWDMRASLERAGIKPEANISSKGTILGCS